MFDIAVLQTADGSTKCFHVPKSKQFAGPEFRLNPFLQQMQKYGFYIIGTDHFVVKAIATIKFEKVVLEQTQHVFSARVKLGRRIFAVSV